MKIRLAFVICIFTVLSCKDETNKRVDIPGEYFELEHDNIDIYLPSYFQEFSEDAYGKLIESFPDSEEKRIEKRRFDFLKYSKGNIYYFRDIASSTLISVKVSDFLPFTREQSAQLASILSRSCSDYAEAVGLNCERLDAGYSGNVKTKVFKSSFRMNDGHGRSSYNTIYIISSNYKTFAMNIYSTTNKNYNAYIEKIVVK
ncbi:hypothetical protein [Psychroserpens luteolus]|uniref:hypothetical protein n=1 Tax=Psychroserpens luteolus TaxID=2855840 RepID=UPI001E4A1085|nr:hypothetical protein [Psychroserpens luteolus]MCD2258762.1 hypothetical protein [Psychroserpens luteolus]